jgi:signal transduction histidine kinase/CheY-like chemotaxis protein
MDVATDSHSQNQDVSWVTEHYIELLSQITTALSHELDIQALGQMVVNQLGSGLAVDRCLWGVQEPTSPLFAFYAAYSANQGQETALGNALMTGTPAIQEKMETVWMVPDVTQNPTFASLCHPFKVQSLLAVQHRIPDQSTLYLELHQCDRLRIWTVEEREWLRAIAAHLGLAFAQFQLSQREILHRQEVEAAKQSVELTSQAKGLLLANMSHELRTPLNSILGFSQLLQRDAGLTPKQQKILSTINRSGAHLLQMINDVLEMSKIEAGQSTLKLGSVKVLNLINSLQEMMRLKAEGKGLSLKLEQAIDVPVSVRADASKLRQVLINLLENAIKFTTQGTITLRVWQAQPDKKQLESHPMLWFEVADTGMGMTADELSTIFTPFTQTKTGRQFDDGTGLGLAISRKYVQMMGGNITAESQPQQGTIVRFWIPILPTEALDFATKRSRVMTLTPEQQNYRLLVVEDQPENRQLFVDMLQAVGFEVQAAANGEEAIAQWQSWKPHLIWMDMQMPIMDGSTTANYIKTHALKDNCPVIVALTAYAWGQDRAKVLACGCDDFISKPFNSEAIWAKLTEHLGVQFQEVGGVSYPALV